MLFEILRQPSNLSDEESYPLTLDSVGINVNADGVVVGPHGGTLEEVGLMNRNFTRQDPRFHHHYLNQAISK